MENYFELTNGQKEIIKEALGVTSLENISITFKYESDNIKSNKTKTLKRKLCKCPDGKWKSSCCPH